MPISSLPLDGMYDVITADDRDGDFRCRSLVAVRRESNLRLEQFPLPTAGYHGSYVAAGRLEVPDFGEVVVLSVHASPSQPSKEQMDRWPLEELPPERGGNGAGLWDSDFVLATLVHLVEDGRAVLAGGDFNEALAWDDSHMGSTWGREFFASVEEAGLCDCTLSRWGGERATHGDYQDDHLIVSASLDSLITEVELGTPSPADGSDHHAIWFEITGLV